MCIDQQDTATKERHWHPQRDYRLPMLAICSSLSQEYYELNVGSAISEFPVLLIPAAGAENELNDALRWQRISATRMIASFLRASEWIGRWIEIAGYFDLPVCNLERDFAVYGSDIDFARRLSAQDMVLWWSPSSRPDLGGAEEDCRMEELPKTEFMSPGCYSNVCLEITVRNLAVNAVLHSVIVNELEGSGGATAFDSSRTLDQYAADNSQKDMR